MAKKEATDEKKVFNFLSESPVIRQTEDKVIREYERLDENESTPAPEVHTQSLDSEPTKGVQANLPISLYNRMKRLKYETDETFQSMFQQAIDLWLDVKEGKVTVKK